MFVKGLLVECNKTGLTALSVIIHKATHAENVSHALKNFAIYICEKEGARPDAPYRTVYNHL